MNPQAVIFDFDGTMLDTEWPAFVTARDIFRDHGHDLTIEDWETRIGRGDAAHWSDGLASLLGRSIDQDALDGQRRPRKNALTEEQPIRTGVIRLLDAARAKGLALGVASSSPISWVGGHLERRGLAPYFHSISTRDDVERAKPWPDLFHLAAKRLDVAPEFALVIEDSRNGLLAAQEAGMRCVIVPNDITRGQDFTGAELVLDSLGDLPLDRYGLAE